MVSLIVLEAARAQFVDDAAQIGAEATARRDNNPEVAPPCRGPLSTQY
jgi:hypothetical protein